MIRVLIDTNTGKVNAVLGGDIHQVGLNTPEDSGFVDFDDDAIKPELTAYWDESSQKFISIGEQPDQYHTFDYATKEWKSEQTIQQLKDTKWLELKKQRDTVEFGGFEFEGHIYDSDQTSQGRIMGAAAAGVDQVWTLADNTTVDLTALQLQQLYAALQAHVARSHERGRIARQLIYEAETKEQVESVQL